MTRAIVCHNLQVHGPYKVRHHRGFWITVFEFTGRRRMDVAEFEMGFYKPGFFSEAGRKKMTRDVAHRD